MLRRMDAARALADLTEISSQVVQVAILDGDGSPLATTIEDPAWRDRFIEVLSRLVAEAEAQALTGRLGSGLAQFEASTFEGSVFAVRNRGRLIAATTRPDPTVGLVLYDLRRCLESLDDPAPPGEGSANGATTRRRRSPSTAGRARSPGRVDPAA
jgi:hypothetical protein